MYMLWLIPFAGYVSCSDMQILFVTCRIARIANAGSFGYSAKFAIVSLRLFARQKRHAEGKSLWTHPCQISHFLVQG